MTPLGVPLVVVLKSSAVFIPASQGVGDAISDFLYVEAILAISGMTIQQWDAL